MKKLWVVLALVLTVVAFAQGPGARVTPPAPMQFVSLAAHTTFNGTGLSVAYGQQDFFAPGTDTRFGVSYSGNNFGYYGSTFNLELSANALAYTYDPQPGAGLALVAYGGLGPRLLVQTGIPDYSAYPPNDVGFPTTNAYVLAVNGVGGFETRLNNFGIYLELELGLPVVGLIGPQFLVFPFGAGIPIKLALGSTYYF